MARQTTKRIAVTPETKQLVDDTKPDRVEYDYFVRELLEVYQRHGSN
jgi:hypothetical protein